MNEFFLHLPFILDTYNVNSSIVPTTDKQFSKTPQKKKQPKLKKDKSTTAAVPNTKKV